MSMFWLNFNCKTANNPNNRRIYFVIDSFPKVDDRIFSGEKSFPRQSQPSFCLLYLSYFLSFVLFFLCCFISISQQQYYLYITPCLLFFSCVFINFKISNLNACNKIIIIILLLLLSVVSHAWMSSKWLAVSRIFVILPAIFFARLIGRLSAAWQHCKPIAYE